MRYGKQKQSQVKQTYVNILTAFAVEKSFGKGETMLSVNIKASQGYSTKSGVDVPGTSEAISKEAFLAFWEQVYDGERGLTISLFETDIPQADLKGGLRVTETELEEMEAAVSGNKKASNKLGKTAAARKPRVYDIADDEDDEEEHVPAPAKSKAKPKPTPIVDDAELDEDEMPY